MVTRQSFMSSESKEPQYQFLIERKEAGDTSRFGLMSSQTWQDDPKRLAFVLSRYKFAGKMLAGCRRVLEIGCADAFGTRIVRQAGPEVTAVDFDPIFIENARQTMDARWPVDFAVHDMTETAFGANTFDGAFALDVIEHITPEKEDAFVANAVRSLTSHGVLLLGCPSQASQAHASKPSREGHVNCKDGEEMRKLLGRHFHNVLFFHERQVVHTGYFPMAQYIFGLACGPKVVAASA
jgi:Cyclopropane fatty acid synthase and related methyltransferases